MSSVQVTPTQVDTLPGPADVYLAVQASDPGLGVQGVPVAGRFALGHSGRFLGSRAVMRWIPAERIAIAVETNQSRTDPALLLADLAGLVLTPPPRCVACPTP